MKRFYFLCFLCTLCLFFSTGCGQNSENENNANTNDQDTVTEDAKTITTDDDGYKEDTMNGDDGSIWNFESDGEVTVTATDGSETEYTYRLTTVTAYLTERTTGEEIEADVEYDDDGSIILFFDDGTSVILTP